MNHEYVLLMGALLILGISLLSHITAHLLHRRARLAEVASWLLCGVFLANVHHLGGPDIGKSIAENHMFAGAAFLGVSLLLAKAALETDLFSLIKNLGRGGLVAALGVAMPFMLCGFGLASWLMPSASLLTKLVIGGMVSPTSIGIGLMLFTSMGLVQTKTAQFVLAVAAIDDVIGLGIMSMIQSSASGGQASIGLAVGAMVKAFLFVATVATIGYFTAPKISRVLQHLHGGETMRMKLALIPPLVGAALAHAFGLPELTGVYAGGVFLTETHFDGFSGKRKVEDFLTPYEALLVPVFLVSVGLQVNVPALIGGTPLALFAGCLGVLIGSKLLIARFLAGPSTNMNWRAVGWGTLPRGEVALVVCQAGLTAGVIEGWVFGVCVMLVIATAIITSVMLKKSLAEASTELAPQQG